MTTPEIHASARSIAPRSLGPPSGIPGGYPQRRRIPRRRRAGNQVVRVSRAENVAFSPYLCWGPPVKVGSVVVLVVGLVVTRAWLRWGRGVGSRWSARSAARTNDLDAGADPPHTPGRVGQGEKRCDSNHVEPPQVLREAIEGGKGRASAQPYLGPRTSVRRHDDGWGARRAGW